MPVSYTHLDVYKRQLYLYPQCHPFLPIYSAGFRAHTGLLQAPLPGTWRVVPAGTSIQRWSIHFPGHWHVHAQSSQGSIFENAPGPQYATCKLCSCHSIHTGHSTA